MNPVSFYPETIEKYGGKIEREKKETGGKAMAYARVRVAARGLRCR